MPLQCSRLAQAARCDETAPGTGAARQTDQPLQARLLADPSGSRSGTFGLRRSEFRTGFRTGFRFRLRHPVSADPLWRSGKAGAGHGMASSCACSRTNGAETWQRPHLLRHGVARQVSGTLVREHARTTPPRAPPAAIPQRAPYKFHSGHGIRIGFRLWKSIPIRIPDPKSN